MALTQNLSRDTSMSSFVLGYVNSRCINAGNVGNIEDTGAMSYFTWLTTIGGVNPTDIGGGIQSSTTMGGYILPSGAGVANASFRFFDNTTQIGVDGKLQQPIKWNSNLSVNDVVWGVYLPQTDALPSPTGIGKIMGFSTTIDDAASVGSNDPNSNDAFNGLVTLLGKLGTLWSSNQGPSFNGTAANDLWSNNGLFASGGMLSYSNTNGTWLIYPG